MYGIVEKHILREYAENEKLGKNLTKINNAYGRGVYAIKNTYNNFIYIGKSLNLLSRLIGHLEAMEGVKGSDNKNILNDCARYGTDVFKFYILDSFKNKPIKINGDPFILALEDYYLFIAHYIFDVNLYNLIIPEKQYHCQYELSKTVSDKSLFNPYDTLRELLSDAWGPTFILKNSTQIFWNPKKTIDREYRKKAQSFLINDVGRSNALHIKDDPSFADTLGKPSLI